MGFVFVGLSHVRHHLGFVVELRSIGLEWRMGVGPSGERIVHSMADSYCLHPLGARARASWHVACVELVVIDFHFQSHNSWNVSYAFWNPEQRPRI